VSDTRRDGTEPHTLSRLILSDVDLARWRGNDAREGQSGSGMPVGIQVLGEHFRITWTAATRRCGRTARLRSALDNRLSRVAPGLCGFPGCRPCVPSLRFGCPLGRGDSGLALAPGG
jgi:hypothetical protein